MTAAAKKEAAKAAKEAEKEAATEVTVTWNGGLRVYSLAVHGDAFLEIAHKFAAKVGGTVR